MVRKELGELEGVELREVLWTWDDGVLADGPGARSGGEGGGVVGRGGSSGERRGVSRALRGAGAEVGPGALRWSVEAAGLALGRAWSWSEVLCAGGSVELCVVTVRHGGGV